MKTLGRLAVILITLGAIIAFVPQSATNNLKVSPDQLLKELKSGTQYMSPDELADKIIKKDPSVQLIDVRPADQFQKFSLPGSVNIPLPEILDAKWTETLNQTAKTNVFYSNSSNDANQAWMLVRQRGYENNFVLQGGLNYWFEAIVNPVKPAGTSPNEEFAKYEFRMAAGKALGGGDSNTVQTASVQTDVKQTAPVKTGVKKKKGASGGC
jgi:rhodanese-related sulfurtransferase